VDAQARLTQLLRMIDGARRNGAFVMFSAERWLVVQEAYRWCFEIVELAAACRPRESGDSAATQQQCER
jgi:hypothetical protein